MNDDTPNNISKLSLAVDNTDKRTKSVYEIYHTGHGPEDIVMSSVEGFGMAHDVAFFVIDENYNMLFFVPLGKIVYISATPIKPQVDKASLN